MPVIKCKMCGAQLEINPDLKLCSCQYCGSVQTIPNTDDEQKLGLFNRATALRLKNDFSKASLLYQTIISAHPNDAEAYWGLVLCKYGIEYVDDPKTGEKKPTCHRTSYESILKDVDYLSAIEKADVIASEFYTNEAKQIDDIQRKIIQISRQEKPYDIFICYKEKDASGERTEDSVLAQDIYNELTKKGYRVFFSRITLENKLGEEYEPIIFAALQSAKLMLVIGTKEEYFESPWVKNEWSRYLWLVKQYEDKHIIPCYKNVDVSELPIELLSLQSLDLSKIGSLQDLYHGIDKIFDKKVNVVPTVKKEVKVTINKQEYYSKIIDNIRAGNFNGAMFYIEEFFKYDRIDGYIHFLKAIAEAKTTDFDYFKKVDNPLRNKEFSLAYGLADPNLKEELEQTIISATERYYAKVHENNKVYIERKRYKKAIDDLKSIPNLSIAKHINEKVENEVAVLQIEINKQTYIEKKSYLKTNIEYREEKLATYQNLTRNKYKSETIANKLGDSTFAVLGLKALLLIALLILQIVAGNRSGIVFAILLIPCLCLEILFNVLTRSNFKNKKNINGTIIGSIIFNCFSLLFAIILFFVSASITSGTLIPSLIFGGLLTLLNVLAVVINIIYRDSLRKILNDDYYQWAIREYSKSIERLRHQNYDLDNEFYADTVKYENITGRPLQIDESLFTKTRVKLDDFNESDKPDYNNAEGSKIKINIYRILIPVLNLVALLFLLIVCLVLLADPTVTSVVGLIFAILCVCLNITSLILKRFKLTLFSTFLGVIVCLFTSFSVGAIGISELKVLYLSVFSLALLPMIVQMISLFFAVSGFISETDKENISKIDNLK